MKSFFKVMPLATLLIMTTYCLQAQDGGGEVTQQTIKVDVDKGYQDEMKTLSEKPVIKSAFKSIIELEPETEKDLITLTEIPAPPYKEQKRAQKYMEMLKSIGIDSI